MAKRDYYEVLGLNKNATKDEIRSAYRKLAKQYHPDINKSPDAPEKFKEVQEAYDVLSDDKKRATYDQFGMAAFEQGASTGGQGNPFTGQGFSGQGFGDIDLGDIFNSFFGGGAPRGSARSSRRTGPLKGNDTLMRIKISFMDSINGKVVNIPVTYMAPCPHCHGTGAENPGDITTCPDCGGTGIVNQRVQTFFGTMTQQTTCPRCGGTGKITKETCHTCGGSGYKKTSTNIDLTIPAGISDGQTLRVPGYGEPGINGGENGDLLIQVVVQPDPYFTREGNDIHVKASINAIQATLGCKIPVKTVYNEVEVTVPSGTQPGTVIRLKGEGVKGKNSFRNGDEYIHVDIIVPKNISSSQKSLLEQFLTEDNSNNNKKWKNPFRK